MSDAWVAALSAIFTGLASLLGVFAANRKNGAVMELKIDNINKDIQSLSKRVDEHNKIVERTYKLEGQVTELQHEMQEVKGK